MSNERFNNYIKDATANTAALNSPEPEGPVKVIFRKFPDGDIIAFFPELPANRGKMLSYMRVGQHGEADSNYAAYTKPATPEEFAALEKELRGIYEVLDIRKRSTFEMQKKAWGQQ